jgi:acetyl esterase/lipase
VRTFAYGKLADQVGDLYLPETARPPIICLLHGGFWRLPWGRDHTAAIAVDLARRGFAVWNLEYRRVGTPGGGWPGTLHDVANGIDHLADLAARGERLDLQSLTVVGHSAGGQLALWSASASSSASSSSSASGHGRHDRRQAAVGGAGAPVAGVDPPSRVRITAAVGLAPVADLVLAYELGSGNGAVADFLGGSPQSVPQRYRTASPAALLPLGVKQLIAHGTLDDDVPVDVSRRYAAAAKAAADDLTFLELKSAGHMDFVDPSSAAYAALCRWLEAEVRV